MANKIKIFTHEAIVHTQITALEKTLNRQIEFEINLNLNKVRSNLSFEATEEEINLIRHNLGYTVMIRKGGYWLPEM